MVWYVLSNLKVRGQGSYYALSILEQHPVDQ